MMSDVRRHEVVRWFVTPNELRRIAKRMDECWSQALGGESLIVHCIHNDNDKVLLEVCIDQGAMPQRYMHGSVKANVHNKREP